MGERPLRNGYLPEREIQTGIGPVTVKIPKVRGKNEEAVTFRSALVPPYVRKTRSLVKYSLHEIWQAETREQVYRAFDLFINTFEVKYSKATLTLKKDRDELLAFYDFPAQHWQSLRTTNPIESTFGTMRKHYITNPGIIISSVSHLTRR